jgi:hypothetical protein
MFQLTNVEVLSGVAVIFLSSISKWQFLGCATIALIERFYASHTAIWQIMHPKQLYPSLPPEGRTLGPRANSRDSIKISNISKVMVGEPPSHSIVLYRGEAPFNRKSIVNSYNICV